MIIVKSVLIKHQQVVYLVKHQDIYMVLNVSKFVQMAFTQMTSVDAARSVINLVQNVLTILMVIALNVIKVGTSKIKPVLKIAGKDSGQTIIVKNVKLVMELVKLVVLVKLTVVLIALNHIITIMVNV
jgi:hypothetical protein